MSFSEFPHVMPRCYAAKGIFGGVSKMCCLVEDSLRHLRCRGMTSQGFSLEIPIALLRKSGNDVKGRCRSVA